MSATRKQIVFNILLLLMSTGATVQEGLLRPDTTPSRLLYKQGNHFNIFRAVCTLPPDRGPCMAIHPRFYFDHYSKNCLEFKYGGCGGNANNFETQEECMNECKQSRGAQLHQNQPKDYFILSRASCTLPPDKGPCLAINRRFYFNTYSKECKEFNYGGCGGNANSFETRERCMEECGPSVEERLHRSQKDYYIISSSACTMKPDRGPCLAIIEMFYFDQKRNRCLRFKYGGCLGNGNRFATRKLCRETCVEGGGTLQTWLRQGPNQQQSRSQRGPNQQQSRSQRGPNQQQSRSQRDVRD